LSVESLPAILHERFLRRSAQHAFEAYTGWIGEWWDPADLADPSA
jgi:hypothetical protein